MIRTLIFDIGNVLLYFSHEKMCQQVGALIGVDPQFLWNSFMIEGLGQKYEKGEILTSEITSYLSHLSTKSYSQEQLFYAFSDIFTPNESLIPLVPILKGKGIRLILLSNISEMHMDFIKEKYPVINQFDKATLSFQVKALKPQEAIFHAAIHAAKCLPHECFYTDDIAHYVASARKLGIEGEPFTSTPEFLAQLNKRNLFL